jgi:methionine sulfoxide reductase catalytic subunit
VSEPWNLPDRELTPEPASKSRRRFLIGLGLGGAALAGGGLWWNAGSDDDVLAAGRVELPHESDFFPAKLNEDYHDLDRPLSGRADVARYCNFYEFSVTKQVWRWVGPFQPVPWTLEVAGLVAQPRTYDLDDLFRIFPMEERNYRHRCVEAWAMAVPWTGFPLAELLRAAGPLPGARYVRFVTFQRPEEASRQTTPQPWPYTEGLTLAEATNELTLLATGIYGHPLLKQHGAPVRLVVPWKYGFKSAKSIVKIELTDRRPTTFWNTLAPHEYGFEANVEPTIPHPRWSQATERMLGSGETRATQRYNGYGEWVSHLYRT